MSTIIHSQSPPNTADDDRDPTVSVASPTNALATPRRYSNTDSGEIRKLHYTTEWRTFFSQVMVDFTAFEPSPSPEEVYMWSWRLEHYQSYITCRLSPFLERVSGCKQAVLSIEHGTRVLKVIFETCDTHSRTNDSIEELVNSEQNLSSQSQGLNRCEHCGLSLQILLFRIFVTKVFRWDGESWSSTCEAKSFVNRSLDFVLYD